VLGQLKIRTVAFCFSVGLATHLINSDSGCVSLEKTQMLREKSCPRATWYTTVAKWTALGLNSSHSGEEPAPDNLLLMKSVWWLGYGLEERGSIPGRGRDIYFFSPPRPDWLWSPSSLLSNGCRGLILWGWSWPPPCSAKVNEWSYTSTLPYVFTAWCLIKHRDNFTFFLYLTDPHFPFN
jgi:hypothetical protein